MTQGGLGETPCEGQALTRAQQLAWGGPDVFTYFKQRVPVREMGNFKLGETIPALPPLPCPANPESKEWRQGILILPSLSQVHRLIESLCCGILEAGAAQDSSPPGAASAPQCGDIRSSDSAAQRL